MGGRDYRHREAKKPKKTARSTKVEALAPSAEVEVVRKKRVQRETEVLEESGG